METIYYVTSGSGAKSVWSKFGPIILGFILTSLLGGLFTWRLQALATARQTRLELFRKRYDEGTVALADVSGLIDTRYFALQRLLWAIADGSFDSINLREKDYFDVVVKWNNSLRTSRNKIRLLVGEDEADGFLDYQDDARGPKPRSIHYQFVVAHREVMECRTHPRNGGEAQDMVTHLNYSLSSYLERITTEFSRRANSLAILQVPPSRSANGDVRS